MKLLVVLLAIVSFTYATGACYTPTSTPCRTTSPNDGTYWSYCPEKGIWTKIPCGDSAAYTNLIDLMNAGYICSGGYLQEPTGNCDIQRDATPEIELSERITYATCPITGSVQVVCCYSPKTCYSGNTVTAVCH